MYVFENPVLQRELLVNLRTSRAFVLLAVYQILLGIVVLAAWPSDARLDLTTNPPSARKLVNLFFLGQYIIASLIAPSFAAGAITGEKERRTYEMLLASPLRPAAIVIGKMVASLTHLVILIIASLPIIVLCLPLGGVSIYEVLAAYLGLAVSVLLFGAVGMLCSSYFGRTSSSLVVSYLIILPLVLFAVLTWQSLESNGELRLKIALMVWPAIGIAAVILMCANAAGRMLYPPDMGSEGKEVVDLERESEEAIGLVINPDQFPDRLFAPPKKQSLMPDGTNPVYDKELHSEIFSQGTLMLRLVIQISMLLAIPLMGVFLFLKPEYAPWFSVYVIVFSMLVGPVFLAGSMTSERERETLDLLLTTTLTSRQILVGKFLVGFRVSAVLTAFIAWPIVLSLVLNELFYSNWSSILSMLAIILMVCLVNAVIALACSLFQRRTSMALMSTYIVLLLLYVAPPATTALLNILGSTESTLETVRNFQFTSPFSTLFSLPLDVRESPDEEFPVPVLGNWTQVIAYFAFSCVLVVTVCFAMTVRLRSRRGLSE
jgi:ABC-type transport system involved in multi-copper enzyme maturation permease subunit